jgi:uncharacterized protein (DUF302 family)
MLILPKGTIDVIESKAFSNTKAALITFENGYGVTVIQESKLTYALTVVDTIKKVTCSDIIVCNIKQANNLMLKASETEYVES